MTQDQYVIQRKLNILELGETLGIISDLFRRGIYSYYFLSVFSFSVYRRTVQTKAE